MLAKGKAPIGVAVPEALGSHRCRKAGAGCKHSRGEMPEKARNQARKGIGVRCGSFCIRSQEKTADAVFGETGETASGAWSGAGASAGAIHHPTDRSGAGRLRLAARASQARSRQQDNGRGLGSRVVRGRCRHECPRAVLG